MYITIQQTAAILSIPERKVRRMIADGDLMAAPIGGPRGTRILVASLPVPEQMRKKLIEASLKGIPAAPRAALIEALQSVRKVEK